MFADAMDGLTMMLHVLWIVPIGVLAGMFIGAIPGLNSSGMLAILVPVIILLPPEVGLIFAMSLYAGGETGNAFPAIMLNIPGDASTAVTAIEGHPMMMRGDAAKALGLCVMGSAVGAVLGGLASLSMSPLLSTVALRFSSVEICIIILFGLCAIAQISSSNLAKGLLMGFLGMLIGTTGPDPRWGEFRGTFDSIYLYDGIPIVAVLIGLLGFSELLKMIEDGTQSPKAAVQTNVGLPGILSGFMEALRYPVVLLRSCLTGIAIGIIPGAGGSIASFLSYQQALSFARPKERERFGKGSTEGLLAGDTANNACVGGSVVPLLTLGIPGSTAMAVLLIVMQYHNLTIGPRLFSVNGDIAYALLWSQFAAALLIVVMGGLLAVFAYRIAFVPAKLIIPIIGMACVVGSFAENRYVFDMGVMVAFGVLGYILKKNGFPVIVLLLGIILGPAFEAHLQRGLGIGFGSPTVFFTRPIALLLWGLLLVTLLGPLVARRLRASRDA